MHTILKDNPLHKMWSQATNLADRTPTTRNRYVDFLRAVSILAVVVGHWLVAAVYVKAGEFIPMDILSHVPWTQWLSWLFQVMPIFFIVGGFANSLSWRSAQRNGQGYRSWLLTRLRRLLRPVLPLVVVWIAAAGIAYSLGVDPHMIKTASRFALLPTWFLIVYIIVVTLVPITYKAWIRFGFWSFWGGVSGAVIVDMIFFAAGVPQIGWINYLFVWASLHQLGYAWQQGQLVGLKQGVPWAVSGLLVLIGLVTFGPYPLSMVTVPNEAVSNTVPPKLPLIALGIFQAGVLLSLEPLARRWLANIRLWSATVLVNGLIMTTYLWHITALMAVTGLALALGGIGLTVVPGSIDWWLSRPVWFLVLTAALLLFALIFARFEHPPRWPSSERAMPVVRLVVGSALFCAGLLFIILGGLGELGPHLWMLSLPFAGAALLQINPLGGLLW